MTTRPKISRLSKTIYRSKRQGCFKMLASPAWGKTFVPIDDPQGEEFSEEDINRIQLIKNFPKIPSRLWSPWVNLVFHYCPKGEPVATGGPTLVTYVHGAQLEVECLFLRKASDLRSGKISKDHWKIVIPKQTVSSVSVDAEFDECCDIVTGEEYKQFPPPRYVHAGSSHSHNTMAAFFSAIDDEWELGVPGLHVVLGKINKFTGEYEVEPSIVLQKQRKTIELEEVADLDHQEVPFHPNVLNYVEKYKPPVTTKVGPSLSEGRGYSDEELEPTFEEVLAAAGSDEIEIITEEEFAELYAREQVMAEALGVKDEAEELPW